MRTTIEPNIFQRYGSDPGIIYSAPDGEKCLEKSANMTFLGAKLGSMAAILDIMLKSRPNTVFLVAGQYAMVMSPFALGAGTFAATACLAGSIRKRDDILNHIAGGFAGGFVTAIRGGTKYALGIGLLLSLVAGAMKQAKVEGHDIWPDTSMNKEFGSNRESWMLPPPDQRAKPPENY